MTPLGSRRSYPALAGTVLVIAGIFGLSVLLRPLIPPPEPNVLVQASGEFVRAGARQQVQWRLDLVDAFQDGRAYGKPILVISGHRLSHLGRRLDEEAFTDPEVIEKMNLRVIPVRVDLAEQPEWEDGVLPITRTSLGLGWGLDVAVFRPDGRLIAWPSIQRLRTEAPADWMLDVLNGLPQTLRQQNNELTALQESEHRVVRGPMPPEELDIEGYADGLMDRVSSEYGGIPRDGRQEPLLWEWQALATSDRLEAAEFNLQRLLGGEIMDWLYGGVFHQALQPDWSQPSFSKSAVQNADLAALAARMAVWRGDEQYRGLAEWLSERILSDFSTKEGFASWSYGLREADGRCLRYCLPAQALLGRGSEAVFLRDRLGLKPLGGPIVIRLTDWRSRFRRPAAFEPILWQIRDRTEPDQQDRGQLNDAAVIGTVAARLMETGMLLGDEEITRQGRELMSAMAVNESGQSDIVKQDGSAGDLRDYLAFSDAAYWRWMTLRDGSSLRHGEAVLRRAMTLFLNADSGLVLPRSSRIDVPGAPISARWTDGLSRSEVATAIRLLDLYASTLGQSNLRDTARLIAAHYTPAANRSDYRVGGLMDAIQRLESDSARACIGRFAESAWRRQVSESPLWDVVISPQSDLPPGVYQVRNAKITDRIPEPRPVGPIPPPES